MGDGTEENPLTREDVLRLIEENGATAEGLDLSHRNFEEGIDLRGLDLQGIILEDTSLRDAILMEANLKDAQLVEAYLGGAVLDMADLTHAHLEGAYLGEANLRGANLVGAHLEGADLKLVLLNKANLMFAHLEGADLGGAYLEGADLSRAEFDDDTRLEGVDWGNYILGEEYKGLFFVAVDTYRQLKMWYTEHGLYAIADKFFFREMTAKRKALKWWPKPWNRAFSKLLSILCGYGERPLRVVISAIVVVFGLALIYFAIGTLTPNTFLNSLYYSAVSSTALGYGSWAPEPTGWVKGLGAFEAFVGVFMMALFLITFVRKMTR